MHPSDSTSVHPAASGHPSGLAPWALAALLGSLTAVFHLTTANDSWGLFRDELYYLANSEHLGFGYVDHPPMIGWLTWLTRHLFGDSMTALRSLPALAAGATVAICMAITREIGGGRTAQLLAGIATALAPVYVSLFGFLSMNAFDVMFWAAMTWALVRLLRTRDPRWWVVFGVIAGVALLNKISPLYLGFGVVVGLLATRDWRQFTSRWVWFGGGIAALLFLPYLIWEVVHGWPTLEFMANAALYKNVALSPWEFLAEQALMINPLVAPIAIAGLWWLLVSPDGRPFRAVGWAVVVVFIVMVATHAKAYYFTPSFPMLLAPGAVFVERHTASPRMRWLRVAVPALVAVTGALLAPVAKPLLPVESFVAYQQRLGLAPREMEHHEHGRLPQFFADRLGWPELAATAAGVYHALPEPDRTRACIFGQNYGQAGAIDFYGARLGLPKAISGHNSYHLWGPRSCTGEVVIVIGDHRERLEELFESVQLAAVHTCTDCMPYENNLPIWVCRGLRMSVDELWPQVASYG